jgi:hypothetical protein
MACAFDQKIHFEVNTRLTDIQLRLKGSVCRVSGRIAGVSKGSEGRSVILFDEDTDRETRQKIRSFVFSTLQSELNKL